MIETTELGKYPILATAENLKIRPDRRAVASALPHENRVRVGELSAEGWRYQPSFENVFPTSIVYNATGKLAYVAVQTDKQFIVVDGEAQADTWDGVSDELGWCADSSTFNFVGLRGKESYVAGPDNRWKIQENPIPRRFAQNADGSRIAWITQSDLQRLYINGTLRDVATEFLANPNWSPDGSKLAWAKSEPNGIVICIDDHQYGPYTSLNIGTTVWSPDSRHCAWIFQHKGKSVLVINGDEQPLPYSIVMGGTFVFNPFGKHWAVTARTGFLNLKGCILTDSGPQPTYTGLGQAAPVWSPDGKSLAYFALRGLKDKFAVVGDREGQLCDGFIDGSLTWHPDSEVVGYVALRDKLPCVLLESRDGRSWDFRPTDGHWFRSDTIAFGDDRTLHDLSVRDDGTFLQWTAHF